MDPLQQARSLFLRALEHHDRNQLQEAEQLYRQALALAPDRCSILTNLSAILIATGRPDQAQALCHRVLALEPGNAVAVDHLRTCANAIAPAEVRCKQAAECLAQAPDDPHLLNAHALALLDVGQPGAAADALRRALALAPSNAGLLVNLALANEAEGRAGEGMSHYVSALRLQPDLEAAGQALARLLLELGPPRDVTPVELDGLLIRALRTPWMRPQSLVALVTRRLHGNPALQACMGEHGAASPPTGVSRGLTEAQRALAGEPLLLALLDCALVADPDLERVLTACRAALLHRVTGSADRDEGAIADAALLEFVVSLAGQCFHNGYAYAVSTAELELHQHLSEHVHARLDQGEVPDPLALAVLGCYTPLGSLRGSARLLAPGFRAGLPASLLRRQVKQPLTEADLRADLTVLTPTLDGVSRQVQQQYEEHPYPRWSGLPRHTHKVPLEEFIHKRVAGISGLTMPDGQQGRFSVLNAGCGTGQHPIDLMLRVANLDMLAIDLSRTSLGYAQRMASEMGINHLQFAQADILELGTLGRRFDLIDSAGVLHHLQSPTRGMAVLRGLLAPRGIFRIALYSERARHSVVACREHIARFGYPPTDDGIRRLRQQVLALPAGHPARGVSRFSDFYALQECRDLVFHVQDHRFTLAGIEELLASQQLSLLGLQLQPSQRAGFLAQHRDPSLLRSLRHWDAYEQANPDTFADMFVLWAQSDS